MWVKVVNGVRCLYSAFLYVALPKFFSSCGADREGGCHQQGAHTFSDHLQTHLQSYTNAVALEARWVKCCAKGRNNSMNWWGRELNHQPLDYKATALPLQLLPCRFISSLIHRRHIHQLQDRISWFNGFNKLHLAVIYLSCSLRNVSSQHTLHFKSLLMRSFEIVTCSQGVDCALVLLLLCCFVLFQVWLIYSTCTCFQSK